MQPHGGASPGDGTLASSYTRTTTHESLRIILLSGRNQTKKEHRERNVIYIKLRRDKLISSPSGRMGVGWGGAGGRNPGHSRLQDRLLAVTPVMVLHGNTVKGVTPQASVTCGSSASLSSRSCFKRQLRSTYPNSTLQNPGFICSVASNDPHRSPTSADEQDKTTISSTADPKHIPFHPIKIHKNTATLH